MFGLYYYFYDTPNTTLDLYEYIVLGRIRVLTIWCDGDHFLCLPERQIIPFVS